MSLSLSYPLIPLSVRSSRFGIIAINSLSLSLLFLDVLRSANVILIFSLSSGSLRTNSRDFIASDVIPP